MAAHSQPYLSTIAFAWSRLTHLPPPSTLPPGSVVDAYVRDSGGPRQQDSTDQQISELETYCSHYGLNLRHVYKDVAKSGGSTIGRDDFNKMMDMTRKEEDRPAGLLLWSFARFARNLDDAVYYKALLRKRDVIIHSMTDPVPEGQFGRIVELFIDLSDEEKKRQTSTDARRGLHDLVTVYGCVPGRPPRGFICEPVILPPRRDGSLHVAHRWVLDPALSSRVRKAFEMRANGYTLSQIHKELHLFGALNSYKTFFRNRLYIGILEFGGLVVEKYCEPLMDMETWNAVQRRIEEHAQGPRDRYHPRRANSPYLLSGLVYCGECGSSMTGTTVTRNRGRTEAYRCSRSKRRAGCTQGRIGRKKLEEAILATLQEYILLPDSLAAIYEIQQNSIGREEAHRLERLATLRDERKKLSGQIANLTRAIAEKGHSQALLDRLTELETMRAQAAVESGELETRRFEPVPSLSPGQIESISKNLQEILSNGPLEKIRQILRALIYKIIIKKEENGLVGTITYFAPGPSFELPLPEEGSMSMGWAPLGAPICTVVRF